MKSEPRKWVTTLRTEKRRGTVGYVVEFTDGRLRASLYGSLPLAAHSALRQAAWESAIEWLSHVQTAPRRLRRNYQRIHFPKNRSHRKHHAFGRKAA